MYINNTLRKKHLIWITIISYTKKFLFFNLKIVLIKITLNIFKLKSKKVFAIHLFIKAINNVMIIHINISFSLKKVQI